MANIVVLLIIVALVTVFSAQNASPVAISFLFWKFETPLAVVIFLSVFAGVLMTALIAFSEYIKKIIKK